ncbi:MAG: hypothetical protein PHX38_00085 [Sulfuricella sp.]|nr:hypothetical protein [Sulfuricella sp.]
MKKLIVLLLFSINAVAEPLPGDIGEYVLAMHGLVKAERVVIKNGNSSDQGDVGLLIPSKEIFSTSTELTPGGRLALEKAGRFAKGANKKLTVLVPDERENKDFRPLAYSVHGVRVKRNAFVGQNVFIVIAGN